MRPIRHRQAPPQHEAGEADRQAGDGLLAGPLGVERPGRQHDEQRLSVGEHGGDAGGEVLGSDVHGGGADRCVGEPEPGDDRPLDDPPAGSVGAGGDRGPRAPLRERGRAA